MAKVLCPFAQGCAFKRTKVSAGSSISPLSQSIFQISGLHNQNSFKILYSVTDLALPIRTQFKLACYGTQILNCPVHSLLKTEYTITALQTHILSFFLKKWQFYSDWPTQNTNMGLKLLHSKDVSQCFL